jgi:hypothetical protein
MNSSLVHGSVPVSKASETILSPVAMYTPVVEYSDLNTWIASFSDTTA